MQEPIFRNPDKVEELPYRKYIRDLWEAGGDGDQGIKDGLSVEDLDLLLCQFGWLLDRSPHEDGRLVVVEVKSEGFEVGYAQKRVFKLLHRLLRKADPEKRHYAGLFVLHWDNEHNLPVDINGIKVTPEQFKDWLIGKTTMDYLPKKEQNTQ